MNTNKKEIQKRIEALTHQKYEIEQELLSLQKEYSEIFKTECEQYIGKCYKQFIEDADEGDIKNTYYKILSFYDDEDDGTQFWALVIEDHMENDIDIPLTYIYIKHQLIYWDIRNSFLDSLCQFLKKSLIRH